MAHFPKSNRNEQNAPSFEYVLESPSSTADSNERDRWAGHIQDQRRFADSHLYSRERANLSPPRRPVHFSNEPYRSEAQLEPIMGYDRVDREIVSFDARSAEIETISSGTPKRFGYPKTQHDYSRCSSRSISTCGFADDDCKPTTIEVAPGQYLRLRGADETRNAILDDYFVPTECPCCCKTIFCIQDASFVLCPECKVVQSLHADDQQGGVGLGFTFDHIQEVFERR